MKTELTSRSLLATFFRQRNKFMVVFLLFVWWAIATILFSKPMFEASGSMLVRFGQGAIVEMGEQHGRSEVSQNDRREIMQSNIEILQSRDLLRTVVREFTPDRVYPGITKRVSGRDSPEEAAIKKIFRGDLTVKSAQQSNVIELRLLNENPEVSAKFIQRLMELFIARQSEVYNKPQLAFLEEQVKDAEGKLQKAQKALYTFKIKYGISSLDEELDQLLRQKADAATISFEALAELQAKETEMLATYKPNSPQVRQIRESIWRAKEQIRQRETENKSGALASQVSTIDGRISVLESQRTTYSDLLRDVRINEETYKTYVTRTEEARINETLNAKKISRISVVDMPVVPIKPARPRKMLTLALCILAGLLFGAGIAALFEALDERFTTPEQVAATLNVPVLATFGAGGGSWK